MEIETNTLLTITAIILAITLFKKTPTIQAWLLQALTILTILSDTTIGIIMSITALINLIRVYTT